MKKEQREDTRYTQCPKCLILQSELEALKHALEERKNVEKAKWILVERKGISEEEAHNLLRASARQQRKKLEEVAEAVIMGEEILKCRGADKPG